MTGILIGLAVIVVVHVVAFLVNAVTVYLGGRDDYDKSVAIAYAAAVTILATRLHG